jgi:hypothetical protein
MSALVVNLFAGPGAGKSTTAAGVFSNLKRAGRNVELVTEYAKDLTWENRNMALDNQIYILGKQYHRLFRVINQVEVAITDSPLMFGAIYCPQDYFDHFKPLIVEVHESMNSLNYFVNRAKPYNTSGRSQTEEQAKDIDVLIRCALNQFRVPYTEVPGDDGGIDQITQEVLACLEE